MVQTNGVLTSAKPLAPSAHWRHQHFKLRAAGPAVTVLYVKTFRGPEESSYFSFLCCIDLNPAL